MKVVTVLAFGKSALSVDIGITTAISIPVWTELLCVELVAGSDIFQMLTLISPQIPAQANYFDS